MSVSSSPRSLLNQFQYSRSTTTMRHKLSTLSDSSSTNTQHYRHVIRRKKTTNNMEVKKLIHIGLPPIGAVDPSRDRPWLLILGSAPSVLSLERQQYYGNPRNHFWEVIREVLRESTLTNIELTQGKYLESYEYRIDILRQAGVIVWDICKLFERVGSSDATLNALQVNDIQTLVDSFKGSLKCIACNGAKCHDFFQKHIKPRYPMTVLKLPSTSPANAMKDPIGTKSKAWIEALKIHFTILNQAS